jgi:hypothetical protein
MENGRGEACLYLGAAREGGGLGWGKHGGAARGGGRRGAAALAAESGTSRERAERSETNGVQSEACEKGSSPPPAFMERVAAYGQWAGVNWGSPL